MEGHAIWHVHLLGTGYPDRTEIGWSRGGQVPIEEYDNLYKRWNPTSSMPANG